MTDIISKPAADTHPETMTGAEIVVRALVDQGVECLFGYPGGAVLPIYDALFHEPRLQHILVRHEQGATHAAEGYARSTGKPPSSASSSGCMSAFTRINRSTFAASTAGASPA